MKQVPAVLLALLPAIAVVSSLAVGVPIHGEAAPAPFRCSDSSLYFPASGIVGWRYQDPASTDVDTRGNRTVHTGVDVFAEEGDGAPVFAPADGHVSRLSGSEGVNIVLPGVTNAVNGEQGVELYITHIRHGLSVGQTFRAGDLIGVQYGDHVHFSVGAFIGYDDREVSQTQDPSPYFGASLAYDAGTTERFDVSHWCNATVHLLAAPSAASPAAEPAAPAGPATYVIESGDTLSRLAESFGVSLEDLIAANPTIDPDFLSIGQEIFLPAGAAGDATPTVAAAPAPGPASAGGTYVVQDGDTLSSLAERFGLVVSDIVRVNALADPDVLAIGDVLVLP